MIHHVLTIYVFLMGWCKDTFIEIMVVWLNFSLAYKMYDVVYAPMLIAKWIFINFYNMFKRSLVRLCCLS